MITIYLSVNLDRAQTSQTTSNLLVSHNAHTLGLERLKVHSHLTRYPGAVSYR